MDISLIDEFVKQNILNSLNDYTELYDGFLKIYLNELGEMNIDAVLNNYLNENCGFNICLESFFVDNYYVNRTILINTNRLLINYWFSKKGKSYNYATSIDIFDLNVDMSKIISSISSQSLNIINFLTSNLITSIENNTLSIQNTVNILDAFNNPISIIIPIYNAYEDTKKAIESVFMNTTLKFNLILIDDCSTDNRISLLLDKYEKYENVLIIRNEKNNGFTKNVNIGIKSCTTDVVLLNSDAIVTPKWDQKLIFSAYSDEKIGTITPFSNASDVSVPIIDKNNKLPDFLNLNEMAHLVEKISCNGNIQAPTGNGFCLFIKRAAINDIGLFDEEAFDKGYGEETDFTMRLNQKGWKNIRNDSIFIYHNRSASFSSKKEELKKNHKKILKERYPNVFDDFQRFAHSSELTNSISAINFELTNFDNTILKDNVLYITDLINEKPLVDDVEELSKKVNIFPLTLGQTSVKLWFYDSNEFVPIKEVHFIKELPNLGRLNKFYAYIYNYLKIDFTFLRFSLKLQLRILPEVAPLKFSSNIKIPILYGRNSNNLLTQLDNKSVPYKKINFEKEKGVVYTAIFGDYESLLNPKIVNPNLDYICFTDNPNLKSDIWNIKLIDMDLDNTRKARTIKTLPHKFLSEYDFSFWFDAAFQIIGDLEEYVNTYAKEGLILGVKHSWRNGIYEEVEACISRNKDDETVMRSQVERYKSEGYPKNNGLIESGALFRRHNDPRVINIMEQWHHEIMNYSKRDQLSFDYVCWKNNFVYDKVPIFYWKNHYFEHFYHIKNVSNNRLTKNQFRVILIANDDLENTRKSINSISTINNDIPISIISLTDFTSFNSYSINSYQINNSNKFIDEINDIVNKFDEKFIYIICSGDIIKYHLIEKLINIIPQEKFNDIGAFILGDFSYIEKNINGRFNSNSVNNGILLNRSLLKSFEGFENSSEFINEFLLKISNKYDIVKDFTEF